MPRIGFGLGIGSRIIPGTPYVPPVGQANGARFFFARFYRLRFRAARFYA